MANFIQQFKVGDQTYDLYDSEFIVDTRTAAGASLTGLTKSSALFDGMQITFWLAYASAANATLTLTFPDTTTTGAIPCYYNGTTRLSTHYPAGSIIHFTYRTNVTIGSTTISAGWWSDSVGSVTYASSAGGLSAEIANARLPLRLQASSMTAQASANNTLSQGWWYIGSADSVKPPFKQVDGATGNDYRVMTTAYNDTWLQQIATDFRSNDVFIRRRQSGTWQPWTALVKMPQGATAAQLVPTTGSIAIFDNSRNATIKGSSASIDTNGALTATNITDSGLTASQAVSTDANKKLVSTNLSVSSATDEATEATRFVHSVTQSAVGKITVKTRPMPSIPTVPNAPNSDGNYNLNVSSGTATWVTPNDHILIINGTPTGDLADYPITTDTLWSDYISAIANHDRIILDMPLAGMKVELFAQDYAGAYVNTVVKYFNFVMSAALSATEDTSTHTVIFELDQNITTWSAYSDYAAAADEAYRADVVDWSGVENAPEVQPSVGSIILTTSWSGNGPYTQTVTIDDGTANSKIDLQPDATVLSQLMTDGVTAMYVENNNGTFTVYTLGAAPTTALTIQYTRTEVS